MFLPSQPLPARRAGFTLVELLVSMTVLILLVVMVAQLTNGASNTTQASIKRMDADTQARDVFNRMAADFAGMVRRKDVDCFFVKNTGAPYNDAMYFYSDTPGFFEDHTWDKNHAATSLVGYHIANRTGVAAQYPNDVLERVGRGLIYDGGSKVPMEQNMIFLTFPIPTTTQPDPLPVKESTLSYTKGTFIGKSPYWDNPAVTSSNTQNYNYVFSDGVFRLEFCFLMKDPLKQGADKDPTKAYAVPSAPGSTPWATASFMTTIHTGDGEVSMRQVANGDVAAVVVTIAVMDAKTRVLVNSAQMALIRAALVDGKTPDIARTWSNILATPPPDTFASKNKIAPNVATQIRVYQRYFYLN